jgi:hypothetical protein
MLLRIENNRREAQRKMELRRLAKEQAVQTLSSDVVDRC